MKTISQKAAIAQTVEKVNGSADAICAAALGAYKASLAAQKSGAKLADQVRQLFTSPLAIVESTLQAVFVQLAEQVKPDVWPTVANSVATNVRTIVKGLPDEARPQVCYIALDRGACTANVVVMAKPSKAELKARLGHDQKAYNAHQEKLFPAKPAALHTPSEAPKLVGAPDKHEPKGGYLAAMLEQTRGLSVSDLKTLVAELEKEIASREEKRLQAEEAKGKVSAAGKPNAKSRGESQRVAKNRPSKASSASAAPTAPTVEVQPTTAPSKARRSTRKPEAAPVCTPTAAAA